MSVNVTIYCNNPEKSPMARRFAKEHQLAFSQKLPVDTDIYLDMSSDVFTLSDQKTGFSIQINFTEGALAHRLKFGGGKSQTIAKALGISSKNKPHILDATAGLGRDALVLANLGCKLTLVEQSPVLAAMLLNAKELAARDEVFQIATQAGFTIIHGESAVFLQQIEESKIDVIYLDPMYPEARKKALVKKDMQILQKMLGHSSEEQLDDLLKVSLNAASQRVVVKRPKSAPPLTGPAPTLSLSSKKTRYDIYVTKTITGRE